MVLFFEPPPVTITRLKSFIPNSSAFIFSEIIFPSTKALKVSPGLSNNSLVYPVCSKQIENLERGIYGVISGYSINIPNLPLFPGSTSFINLLNFSQVSSSVNYFLYFSLTKISKNKVKSNFYLRK